MRALSLIKQAQAMSWSTESIRDRLVLRRSARLAELFEIENPHASVVLRMAWEFGAHDLQSIESSCGIQSVASNHDVPA